ncbi:hypothetical protein KY331_03585 [Candidatus Woesearchaeota archaeon]|nr:hypothetical protein [Candidatus Woesearchaeota archaeon]
MLKFVKKYTSSFDIENAQGIFNKIFFSFMLSLPHILPCLILTLFYPKQLIGIFIIGWILPDISYFIYVIAHNFFLKLFKFDLYSRKSGIVKQQIQKLQKLNIISKEKIRFHKSIGGSMKVAVHVLTFVIIVFLLLNKEHILFLSGAIHIFLDLLGF